MTALDAHPDWAAIAKRLRAAEEREELRRLRLTPEQRAAEDQPHDPSP